MITYVNSGVYFFEFEYWIKTISNHQVVGYYVQWFSPSKGSMGEGLSHEIYLDNNLREIIV